MMASLTFASAQPLVYHPRGAYSSTKMADSLVLRGTMRAHTDWVTAIATPIDNSEMIVTSYCDKSIIVWCLTMEDKTYGVAHHRLTGHSHFVQDVVLYSDGQFALSGHSHSSLSLSNPRHNH
ncbi:unnamed protein product [Lactuca saligna]|uniref:Uncharacterized protein n=1 Tax=Lactuca saligna TaxID=75948 RepID=A0AA36A5F3_LACSI|nr:unnamed protein product [Lactuca saligna]